jgi:PAS domain S-box-containing protein
MKNLRELLATAIGCALLAYSSRGYPLGSALVPVLSLLPGFAVGAAWLWGTPAAFAAGLGAWAGLAAGSPWQMALAPAACVMVQALGCSLLLVRGRGVESTEACDLANWRRLVLRAALPAGAIGALFELMQHAAPGTLGWAAAAPIRFTADGVGVVVCCPVLFAFFARPRDRWRAWRLSLALPLVAAVALFLVAAEALHRRDLSVGHARFESQGQASIHRIKDHLNRALDVQAALRGAMIAAGGQMDAATFEQVAKPWMQTTPGVLISGWLERVARRDVPAYEAAARAAGDGRFRVEDRSMADVPQNVLDADDDVAVVRYRYPPETNWPGRRTQLGTNMLSVGVTRRATLESMSAQRAIATSAFYLDTVRRERVAFGLQGALPPLPAGASGLVRQIDPYLVVSMALLLEPHPETGALPQNVCIIDEDPAAPVRLLSGRSGCESGPIEPGRVYASPFSFAGRQWSIRVERGEESFSSVDDVWLFVAPGLATLFTLTLLLLFWVSRVQRVEALVDERTVALRAEADQRQNAEQSLQEGNKRYEAVFNTVPAGVVLIDKDRRILRANPTFASMLGYTTDELEGMTMTSITPPEDLVKSAHAPQDLAEHRVSLLVMRKSYLARDGSKVPVEVRTSMVWQADGRPSFALAAVHDLRDMMRAQAAEHERDAAASASQAKTNFVTHISHELRTPLNAVLGFSQMLQLRAGPRLEPHERQWLDAAYQAGRHLLSMVDDLLDLARIEAKRLVVERRSVDLGALARQLLPMLETSASAAQVRLRLTVGDAAVSAAGDPTRVRQILLNLISNAVKYNRAGGEVELNIRQQDGKVVVQVRDTGIGLDAAQLARMFQPFERLGREHSVDDGTGIGLVISKSLAELMGGTLDAASVPGVGTTFTLTLPLADTLLRVAAPSAVNEPLQPVAGYGNKSVLYVEDNEVNVEVMRAMLSLRPQITMNSCGDGRAAIAAVAMSVPDVILLDRHLPDVDGLDLLRRLKADPRLSGVPMVLASADAMPEAVTEALAAGASDYLTKPLTLATLLVLVDGLLAEVATPQ